MNTVYPIDGKLRGLPSFQELTRKLTLGELVQETIRQGSMDTAPERDSLRYLPLSLPPQPDTGFIGLSGARQEEQYPEIFPTAAALSANYGRMELLSEVAHVRLSLAESPLVAETETEAEIERAYPTMHGSHLSQSTSELAYTALARFFEQSESLCESVSQMRQAFDQVSLPVLQDPKGLYDSQRLYATNSCGIVYSTDNKQLGDFAASIPSTMTQDLEAASNDISNTLAAILYLKNGVVDAGAGAGAGHEIPEGMSKPSGEDRPRRNNVHHAARFRMLSIMPSQRVEKMVRTKRMSSNKVCANCKTMDAPEWRRGPDGARSLCNACGLFYKKLVTKYGYEDADCIYYYRRVGESIDRTVPGILEKNLIVQHSRQSRTMMIDGI